MSVAPGVAPGSRAAALEPEAAGAGLGLVLKPAQDVGAQACTPIPDALGKASRLGSDSELTWPKKRDWIHICPGRDLGAGRKRQGEGRQGGTEVCFWEAFGDEGSTAPLHHRGLQLLLLAWQICEPGPGQSLPSISGGRLRNQHRDL